MIKKLLCCNVSIDLVKYPGQKAFAKGNRMPSPFLEVFFEWMFLRN